ncbi:hypothetical protein TRSC58_06476 [Trypanosoma rangeli SC58]|uniref:Leucine-rich repeat protein (LRRP) n=1 Tax=Trypanosoma rangeli SC58 TaxID=429131 RepID=A0A061IUU8_TRYRA|nr:hypothetical protein TRSC58_06476 [Trypanosoma rangeli SC58]
MWDGTPAGRARTPMPRKPRSPPFLFPTSATTTATTRKGATTPVHQRPLQLGASGPSTPSPSKAIVFERTHAPVVENATLPEETLRAARHTRSLFLCCRNLFSFSHIRHLEHMTQLVSLNVHMNALSRIECLGHLQQLTELDVSANELRAVDEDAFKGLRHLKRLNLSSNFLTVINGFQHLPALEWLSLSFNELEDVRGLRRLPCPQQLLHLDVCGNKLADLTEMENSLENCRELQDLRVETPKTALVLPAAPPQLHLRENPFCLTEPNYAERLLQRFQRLVVLNGVTCGCDPAAETRWRKHATTSADCDERLRWHSPDVTSSTLVSPNLTSSQRCTEAVTCDVLSVGEALASVQCGAENVTSLSTSTTGPSSSDSLCRSDLKKDRLEGGTAVPAWRAKRVSRSVLTKVSIPLHKELHVSGVEDGVLQEELRAKDEFIEHLELKFKRSQEHLSLRVALEEDMRRSFEDLRQSHIALVDSTTTEKKRLCRQVTALKDELSRRSEEAVILQRKNRVELEEQAKALRADLLRQRKESAATVRQLEEEAARVRREAGNEIRELKIHLDDAAQQKEWLERQNENAQIQLKKWQNESHNNKTALMACELQLQFIDKSQHLQLEESMARRQLEFLAWSRLVTAVAAQLHLLQCENESVMLNLENSANAWEEYTSSCSNITGRSLLQSHAAKRLLPKGTDVGCDPIGEHFSQAGLGGGGGAATANRPLSHSSVGAVIVR